MATTTSPRMKTLVGGGFPSQKFAAKLTWDFSVDGGESDDTVRIGKIGAKPVLITEAYWHVETACTSGGSATMIIGIEGGDTDAFMDATSGAVASLTDNAVGFETAGQGLYVAANSYIAVDIATADMTAGKVSLYISGFQVEE